MVVRPLDPLVRAQYASEVADRLARIDDALATGDDPIEAARTVYRHVHTMKGAGSSVGDEPMSWFCHGLEERLRVADSKDTARAAMQEVAHWRGVLGGARERIGARVERGHRAAAAIREQRSSLVEALRLIGPPRPWGAPAAALRRVEAVAAALGIYSDEFDSGASRLNTVEHVLRDGVTDAKKQLSAMRQTTVGRMFGRLTTAIESEARRGGCAVIVRTRGADETIDRRIAEHLIEPCLQ